MKKNRATKEKTENIGALERQLTFFQNELEEKNEALVKTQNDLLTMKDQLAAIQSELILLKENSQIHAPQNPDIENKVRDLQSKFQDIQHFLLENLLDSDRINAYLVNHSFQSINN